MQLLTQEKCLLFRITHVSNLPWIFRHGIHCRNSKVADPNFVQIGRPEIIGQRKPITVPVEPGGTLGDYVPFYFTPRSPMLLNIKSGHQGLQQHPMNDIAILCTSQKLLTSCGVRYVFSDRNAALWTADIMSDVSRLNELPWDLWQRSDFARDPSRPDKLERYMAETLAHKHVPLEALHGVVCYSEARKQEVEEIARTLGISIQAYVQRGWYF